MSGIDISAVITEFGNRYIDQGQTMADIHAELYAPGGLEEHFTFVPEDNDEYRGAYESAEAVLQAFSIPFTAKGSVTFKPTKQRLGEFKIDTKIKPDLFRNSWLGFLAEYHKEADRSKWGVIEYILRDHLIPKANDEFKREVAYWGWQYEGFANPPTVNRTTFVRELTDPDAITMANASMDGVHTQIARWAAASRTNQITVGAWQGDADADKFCKQIEDFVFNPALDHLRDHCDKLFMNRSLYRRYITGRRKLYNMNWGQVSDLEIIEGTTIRVVGVNDMAGSENVWMTPARNRKKPTKGKKGKIFDTQKVDREVKILGDWKYVLTFDVPEYIAHSEHDVAISENMVTNKYTEA